MGRMLDEVVAEYVTGGAGAGTVDEVLDDFATAGHDWEMFTARGNAACSAAFREVLTVAESEWNDSSLLAAEVSAAMHRVAVAGYGEVWDGEPRAAFVDAANLLCAREGWEPLSGDEVVNPASVERARLREAHSQAAEALIAAHRDEFDALVAQVLERSASPTSGV